MATALEEAQAALVADVAARGVRDSTEAAGSESLARGRDARTPIRMIHTSEADSLRSGRVQMVRDPKTGRQRALKTPATAQYLGSDWTDVEDMPANQSWTRWGLNRLGNVHALPLTCSSADIPTGGRHEGNAMAAYMDNVYFGLGTVWLDTCFDQQLARGQLDKEWVLERSLLTPSCDPKCCRGEGLHFEIFDGTPHCPKSKAERTARLAYEANRQSHIQSAHDANEISHDTKVAKTQADLMVNALRVLRAEERAEAESKSKKGKE